jgi:BirA family biotin operon repressor/biotin-[acetyl-CoA-carboxylase] ligase
MIVKDLMSADAIRGRLTARVVGRQLYLLGEVDSTNARLRALARAGAADGTVVLAEGQTEGRGRRGQPWFSPSGVNLYASVLFRPELAARDAGVFSFIASLALTDAIRTLGLVATIKWPNDILVDGRKVGGALTECAAVGDVIDHVIVGVGVNVNVDLAVLRSALGASGTYATSLSAVAGRELDRNAFAAAFLNALDAWYDTWRSSGPEPILQAWNDRDILTGRRVEVRVAGDAPGQPGEALVGRVVGISPAGRLLVQDMLGHVRALTAEEVRPID